ncbi:MAG: hypothetical protein K2P94_18280 [Rhodospirillaceae bacterium]|nr:hypothetical protein [Rhodospirillaceae bacterium]
MSSTFWSIAYPAAVVVLVLMLLQTLRLSITGKIHPEKPSFLFTHLWLYPLGILGPFTIGTFYRGALSPWPPAAYDKMMTVGGPWAAVAGFLTVLIVDIWMFWAAAKAIRDTTLTSAVFRPMHDQVVAYYHVVNVLVGTFILYKTWENLAAGPK